MATCNINSLLDAGKCFACLTPGEMDIIELQLLCEILAVAGSSGGGTGGTGPAGDFSGGQPNFTPASEPWITIDTVTEQVWWYYNGAWH
jgi:hypothetical protein